MLSWTRQKRSLGACEIFPDLQCNFQKVVIPLIRLAKKNRSEIAKISQLILISFLLSPGSKSLSFVLGDVLFFPSQHSLLQFDPLFVLPSHFLFKTEVAETNSIAYKCLFDLFVKRGVGCERRAVIHFDQIGF